MRAEPTADRRIRNYTNTMEVRYTMKEKMKPTSYEELPLVLDMKDIQKLLGISRTAAYKLVHTEGFPAFRSGSNIKVSKQALFNWMAKGI